MGLKCIELDVKWSKSGLDKKVGAGQAKPRQNHDQRITALDKPNLVQSNTQHGFREKYSKVVALSRIAVRHISEDDYDLKDQHSGWCNIWIFENMLELNFSHTK